MWRATALLQFIVVLSAFCAGSGCGPPVIEQKAVLTGFWSTIRSIVFSPDGERVAIASGSRGSLGARGDISVWDAKDAKLISRAKVRARYDYLAWMPDGKILLAVWAWGIDLWSPAPLKKLESLPLHRRARTEWTDAALAPGGRWLALISGLSSGVYLVDLEARALAKTLPGDYSCVAFNPDGGMLAAGSGGDSADGSVYLWDTRTWERQQWVNPAQSAEEHLYGGFPMELARFSPDGKWLFTSNFHGRLWDTARRKPSQTTYSQGVVHAAAFSPDGALLATAGDKIRLYAVETGRLLQVQKAHEGGIWAMAFSPTGETLATGGNYDAGVILWSVRHPE